MSPTEKRIFLALQKGPLSANAASVKVFCDRNSAYQILRTFYQEGMVHICAWERPPRGCCGPVYALGPGDDAPRPAPVAKTKRQTISIPDRVRAVLATGDKSIDAASEGACISRDHARHLLRLMHQAKEVHIVGWVRKTRGPYTPIYRLGEGADIQKPDPLPASIKCAKYQNKLKKTHGDNYPAVRRAQRTNIPGRQVVIGGKVVYQQ